MRNKITSLLLATLLCFSCASCAQAATTEEKKAISSPTPLPVENATQIVLSDTAVTVEGATASTDPTAQVYTGADIVYYAAGKDETYGEGVEADSHTAQEAAAQTVVTITQPGLYRISGTLSAGQVAVDLGEEASTNPEAVVTLLLDGVDITCPVAPGVLFYQVYECGSTDAEAATSTVDTSAAGANIILADGSVNYVDGAYVAKIYKEGTDKKLHKYDGAFYSKMSMNISGQTEGTGQLHITATNEGLGAELHLTINGGQIWINAQNDGINTNEDGVSVTTLNGGTLTINAGLGAEGDGIDSNGYLVINGGTLVTLANDKSGDGGIDSDSGIYLNGGTVLALGGRNDQADAASTQPYFELSFASSLPAGTVVSLRNADGAEVLNYTAEKAFQTITYSDPALTLDRTYSVYVDGVQQQFTGHSFGMGGGGMRPDGATHPEGEPPALPEGSAQPAPEGSDQPGTPTDKPSRGDQGTPPSGAPSGQRPQNGAFGGGQGVTLDPSTDFTLTAETHSFSGIAPQEITQ